jgi:hypothetical protein
MATNDRILQRICSVRATVLQLAREEKPSGNWPVWLESADDYLSVLEKEFRSLAKRDRANESRRARHAAMTDLGLKRVCGNMGGTYYE